jgi:hypothetical protein
MARRGRPVSHDRRKLAAELRRQGLTLAEIGRRLGITKQGAQYLLRAPERGAGKS